MPIRLQCVCGKAITLPENLTGQKVKCKDCGKVMTVPAPAKTTSPAKDSNSELEVRNHRRCSGCGKSYPVADKVCTACGVNMDTGAQLYISLDSVDEDKMAARRAAKAAAGGGFWARLMGVFGRKSP